MIVYHGTTEQSARTILSSEFRDPSVDIFNLEKMLSDLGAGIYTYCDDQLGENESNLWNPKKNAIEFARKFKNKYSNTFKVIGVEIKDSSDVTFLDLDTPENKIQFERIRKNLNYRAGQLFAKLPESGAKRRHNIDGILIELAIQQKALTSVDIILKQTYTDFEGGSLSNFYNGKECAIRNRDVILDCKLA